MPIGLGTALTVGAGVLGAGATIYGASQASHAQTQAANTAAGTELAVAQENNALAQQIYGENAARLDPYSQMGLPAGAEFNALLGIAVPAGAAHPAPISTPTSSAPAYSGPSLAQILAMKDDGVPGNYAAAMAAYNAGHSPTNAAAMAVPATATAVAPTAAAETPNVSPGIAQINANRAARGLPPIGGTAAAAAPGATPSPNNAMAGFNTFYNSPTYQFPLQQGIKAVNTGYAAKGALESGAAMKGIETFAANNAAGALGTYMDQLYRQEALGEGASAALAGVGQNMVAQVSANNNNAGSAAANAALVAGQGRASTYNAIGSGIGQLAGGIAGAMGSSYAPNNAALNIYNPNSSIYDGLNLGAGIY
jgi:hypothetical protein